MLPSDLASIGYRPGVVVRVSVLSTGSLLVTIDDTPALDVPYRKSLPAKAPRAPLSAAAPPLLPAAPQPPRSERGERSAAARLGIDYETYRRQIDNGNRWCCRCKMFQPAAEFIARPERRSGYSPECAASNRAAARENQRRKRAAERRAS